MKSTSIKVFPAVNRAEEYSKDSCLLNENNITKQLRYLLPENDACFVTACDITNNKLILVIYGYCFDINYTFSAEDKQNLYACIFIKNDKLSTQSGTDTSLLDDAENNFNGIYFANSEENLPTATGDVKKVSICIINNGNLNLGWHNLSKTKIDILKTLVGEISTKNIVTDIQGKVREKNNRTTLEFIITKGKDA